MIIVMATGSNRHHAPEVAVVPPKTAVVLLPRGIRTGVSSRDLRQPSTSVDAMVLHAVIRKARKLNRAVHVLRLPHLRGLAPLIVLVGLLMVGRSCLGNPVRLPPRDLRRLEEIAYLIKRMKRADARVRHRLLKALRSSPHLIVGHKIIKLSLSYIQIGSPSFIQTGVFTTKSPTRQLLFAGILESRPKLYDRLKALVPIPLGVEPHHYGAIDIVGRNGHARDRGPVAAIQRLSRGDVDVQHLLRNRAVRRRRRAAGAGA